MSITFSYPDNYERKPVQDPADQWPCADCKKPTSPNYRCPACQAKHLKKHRANMDGFTPDETYKVLH